MQTQGIQGPEGRHKAGCVGPSGLRRRVVFRPVAHATGRGCAGLTALTKTRTFKMRERGIVVEDSATLSLTDVSGCENPVDQQAVRPPHQRKRPDT